MPFPISKRANHPYKPDDTAKMIEPYQRSEKALRISSKDSITRSESYEWIKREASKIRAENKRIAVNGFIDGHRKLIKLNQDIVRLYKDFLIEWGDTLTKEAKMSIRAEIEYYIEMAAYNLSQYKELIERDRLDLLR